MLVEESGLEKEQRLHLILLGMELVTELVWASGLEMVQVLVVVGCWKTLEGGWFQHSTRLRQSTDTTSRIALFHDPL